MTIAQTCRVLADLDGNEPDPRTVLRGSELGQLPNVHVGRRVLVMREPLLRMLSGDSPVTGAGVPAGVSSALGCELEAG